jgi:Nuclease-related domain
MPSPHAESDPDGCWPWCDDQRPGVSIRPLSHADLAALLAHLDQHHNLNRDTDILGSGLPAPVVAVRVRASVGRPGASAHAEYRRRRAIQWAGWTRRSLPWRVVAVVAASVAAWLAATQVAPHLAAPATIMVAAALAWGLRFRVAPDTLAWRRGATGERRTARLLAPLERHGWAVLHDLAIPGSKANIDHLVIGPGGVVVIDSKRYWGRLRLDADGLLWHGRHLLVSALRTTLWAADQADEALGVANLHVAAIMAVHGTKIPRGRLQADGVLVAPAQRVPDLLQALPPILGPERVGWLADRARLRFRAAA